MRRYGTALLVLLVPLAAVAKWQVFDVPGVGKAAWISDAGDYAVATTTGAYRLDADGGIVERLEVGATMVDAFIDGRGCLAAVPANLGQSYIVYADAGCGPTSIGSTSQVSDKVPVRLRRAHDGAVYLSVINGADSLFFIAPNGTPADGFAPLPTPDFLGKPSNALAALRSNGTDVALSGLTQFNPPLARIVDAGTPRGQQFTSSVSVPLELALIDPATALLSTGTGELVRVTDLGSTPTWTALPLGIAVGAVGFAPDTDQDQIGLGMAGSTSAGPAAFVFAAPIAGAPGETWVSNGQLPAYAGVAQGADCTVGGQCIAVTNAADAGNVVLYTNAAKPTWAPPAQIVTDAGTVVAINVFPTDPDGDPLAVTWEATSPLSVQPVTDGGSSVDVTVPVSATSCEAPFLDYAVEGSLTDGLAAHRDTRTVTIRVQRVFSPLADATPLFDAGFDPADAQWVGTVDATGLNCPVERGLGATVALTVDGTFFVGKDLPSLPGTFAFPRVGCLAQTGTLTATLTQTDGTPGPSLTRTVVAPAQPAGLDDVVGGPLIASCQQGASANLTVVAPATACPAQSVTWTQVGGPPLTAPTASGEAISVQTSERGLQTLIGETVSLQLTANSGAGTATLLTQIPITVIPFIVTHTELETPTARAGAPLGVRVTVTNPTLCPIDGAALVEQVDDAELVAGTARIDGRPVEATLEDGRLTIPGLSLAPGEPHQVSFDLRPHVLGAPAPTAQIVLRGVPISENSSLSAPPTAAGCSCRTASGGPEGLGYLILGGFLLIWRKRHATPRRQMRKSIR